MAFYGYGPGMPGYKASKAPALAREMEVILVKVRDEVKGMSEWLKQAWPEGVKSADWQAINDWTPGDWPYVQADGPYGGPALRRITNLPPVVAEELTTRCDEAYCRIMGIENPAKKGGKA